MGRRGMLLLAFGWLLEALCSLSLTVATARQSPCRCCHLFSYFLRSRKAEEAAQPVMLEFASLCSE